MSVEQTTQLIQLILNSVLMTVACALLFNRINLRQVAIEERLQVLNRQCLDLLESSNDSRGEGVGGDRPLTSRLLQARKQLRQLQHRYRLVQYSVMAGHYALFGAIASTLLLALRTLLNLEWLIPISLGLFVVGVALLLLSVGLMLVDLHTADRSLWDEITTLLCASRTDDLARIEWRQWSKVADRFIRGQASRLKPSSKARVS